MAPDCLPGNNQKQEHFIAMVKLSSLDWAERILRIGLTAAVY